MKKIATARQPAAGHVFWTRRATRPRTGSMARMKWIRSARCRRESAGWGVRRLRMGTRPAAKRAGLIRAEGSAATWTDFWKSSALIPSASRLSTTELAARWGRTKRTRPCRLAVPRCAQTRPHSRRTPAARQPARPRWRQASGPSVFAHAAWMVPWSHEQLIVPFALSLGKRTWDGMYIERTTPRS